MHSNPRLEKERERNRRLCAARKARAAERRRAKQARREHRFAVGKKPKRAVLKDNWCTPKIRLSWRILGIPQGRTVRLSRYLL